MSTTPPINNDNSVVGIVDKTTTTPIVAHGGTRHQLTRMARANSLNAQKATATVSKHDSNDKRPHVIVIGSGLVGACTSYFLSASGKYRVTTLEANKSTAEATSKANAGRFCPTIMFDYAPKLSSLKSLIWKDNVQQPNHNNNNSNSPATPTSVSGISSLSLDIISWGTSYLRAATYKQTQTSEIMKRLANLSTLTTKSLLRTCHESEAVKLPSSSSVDAALASNPLSIFPNNIWLYGNQSGLDNARKLLQLAGDVKSTIVSDEECMKIIPALHQSSIFKTSNMDGKSIGTGGCAIVKGDFSADAHEFAVKIQEASIRDFHGSAILYGVKVKKIESIKENLIHVHLENGKMMEANRVVIAGGPFAIKLLQDSFGVNVPILPIRGCSIDLLGVENGPTTALADQTSGFLSFQITPMRENKIRLVGFADVLNKSDIPSPGSGEIQCPKHYRDLLIDRVKQVVPGMTWEKEEKPWCGLRPMTPDRLPIVGGIGDGSNGKKWPGIYVNIGHGAMGWTLSGATGWLLMNRMLRDDGYNVEEIVVGDNNNKNNPTGSCAVLGIGCDVGFLVQEKFWKDVEDGLGVGRFGWF
jgi:glycine/D-amino acid oxidase-like deaminating enzyme